MVIPVISVRDYNTETTPDSHSRSNWRVLMTKRNIMPSRGFILVLSLLQLISFRAFSQQGACKIAAPQFQINKPNIFSDQQEQWLGDAQADQLEPEYTLLPE